MDIDSSQGYQVAFAMKRFATACLVLASLRVVSSQCDFKNCMKTVDGNLTLQCSNQGCTEIYTGTEEEKLVRIDLSHNNISKVTALEYTEAQWLNLAYNKIEEIDTGIFSKCFKLQTLDLSHNKITSLDSGHWAGLGSLASLDVSFNNISSLENGAFPLGLLPELLNLDLSNNLISSVQTTAFSDLTSLGSLHLDHNKLGQISGKHFAQLTGLVKAHLNDNELERIEANFMEDCKSLTELYLQNNKISTLDAQSFSKLPKLSILDLRRNKLSSFNVSLIQPNLNELSLGGNLMTEISPNFFKQCTAKTIKLIGLDELTIVKNFSFTNAPNLEKVYISHCKKLTHIEANAFGMNNSKIKTLYLDSNSLKGLPSSLLDWKKVDTVDLSHNPWDCNCSLRWIQQFDVQLIHPDDTKCTLPIHLANHPIKNLAASDFQCWNTTTNFGNTTTKFISFERKLLSKKAVLLYAAVVVTICLLLAALTVMLIRRRRRSRLPLPPEMESRYTSLLQAEDGEERVPPVKVKDNVPEERRKLTDPDPEDV